jgi:hypothetical protein
MIRAFDRSSCLKAGLWVKWYDAIYFKNKGKIGSIRFSFLLGLYG